MNCQVSSFNEMQQTEFRDFINKEIKPFADQYDQDEIMPLEVFKKFVDQGYWGTIISKEYDGKEWDMSSFGILCEEIGRGSASLLSMYTVQGMVSESIFKWGKESQRIQWLPKLAKGEILAAFGLSEPGIGSDAKNVVTTAKETKDGFIVNGQKKWISCGQLADLFLIIAQCDGNPSAFLIERDTPGFSIKPINGMLGFRSAMIAELTFENCHIPNENLLGRIGFGFSHVAGTALDNGRYSIAWGSVGIAQACLEACLLYTTERKQFGVYLKDHQLIQQMIANMITNIKAARLLCFRAGTLKEYGDPDLIMETSIAKYFASKTAVQSALDAVQIHGANGCSQEYPVQRYLRDAKIMEIIEGSTQIQQMIISRHGYHAIQY